MNSFFSNKFFLKKEKILQNRLLKDGYVIFNINKKKRLKSIKNETKKLTLKWLKKNISKDIKKIFL